jgi:hypothetical protein
MPQRSAPDSGRDEGARIGRRGFIGVGLAGAGAALIPPGAAAKAPVPPSSDGSALPTAQPASRSSGQLAQKPLRSKYPHLPAVPVDPAGVLDTLAKLKVRQEQYRITVHGVSRLNATSNPALTFVANFPHCLQRSDIPGPRARIGTKALLDYLPNTDTISQALGFYFIFAFSTRYQPYIPLGGTDTELYFPGGTRDPRNRALIELRNGLASFIGDYEPEMPQRLGQSSSRFLSRSPLMW